MKVKNILLICSIILLFGIASVTASDVDDTTIANDNTEIIEVNDGEFYAETQTDNILSSSGTFTDLNNTINGNDDADIYLDNDYMYNTESAFSEGIAIERAVTIHGNGHTIDAKNQARIFKIENTNVIIKDLVLINGRAPGTGSYQQNGGAISGGCTVINCTFINNTARYGGAMQGNYNNQSHVINCIFENNSANSGGALYGVYATNCNFTNNKAGNEGGAMVGGGKATNCIFINNAANRGGAIQDIDPTNCIFINNKAANGGAMYSFSSTMAKNCVFINNTATSGGGAGQAKSFDNCTFINNSASYGGALYGGYVHNCTFINNTATIEGGALTLSEFYYAENSKFINNSAPNGGAVYVSSYYGDGVTNCEFINNNATDGGAGYNMIATQCTFINNTATNAGGAMYGGTANLCTFKDNSAGNGENDTTSGTAFDQLTCTVQNLTTTYGNEGKLMIEVLNSNYRPIQNIELLIKIYKDNVLVGTYNALSSYDGWTVPLDAGVYTAVVNVKDESAVPGNATITVNKASCTITAKAVSAVYNSKKYLVITLKDAKGNPISNAEVNVNLNGVKNLKTDKNGQIKVLVGKLVPKSYTAKITFNNNNYIQTAKSVNVKVTKAKAKITAKKKTFKKSLKVKKYTITLKNGKTAIKKVKVYIKIKGKTYKATTNKKGKATFKITKLTKKGTFKSKITFKGNKYYKKVTKTVKIKIK